MVDATLDSIAVAVGQRVERRWSATSATAVAAVRSLVRRNRDGHPDAALP
ncbi:hypothetical protein [Nocardia vinacea]